MLAIHVKNHTHQLSMRVALKSNLLKNLLDFRYQRYEYSIDEMIGITPEDIQIS